MTDWTDIHEDFTDELQTQWEKNGFSFWQVQEWIDAGLEPEDADFAFYIENKRGYTVDEVERKEGRVNKLRDEYNGNKKESEFSSSSEEGNGNNEEQIISKKITFPNRNWQNIHSDFTPPLIELWQMLYFTYEQAQDWINIGLQPADADFCYWIRKVKKLTPEQVLNENDLEQLRSEYQQYFVANQLSLNNN